MLNRVVGELSKALDPQTGNAKKTSTKSESPEKA